MEEVNNNNISSDSDSDADSDDMEEVVTQEYTSDYSKFFLIYYKNVHTCAPSNFSVYNLPPTKYGFRKQLMKSIQFTI